MLWTYSLLCAQSTDHNVKDLHPNAAPNPLAARGSHRVSPAEYGAKLERQVNATLALVGPDCRLPWTLGIPVAASAHEYQSYSPSKYHCGPACRAFNNTATMADYVRAAFDLP